MGALLFLNYWRKERGPCAFPKISSTGGYVMEKPN